ncbi:MAG TPA: ABC transporter permease subunit [Candidatus Binatia bacterium]|nr:ABC transporter permease subunit [Candidatus Binatia bacterium]
MTFLPIVIRELRVASRKRVTYWGRTGAALTVIGLGAWLFLMMQDRPTPEISMALFCVLTGSAVFYALLSGVRSADCLSEEKREGTLGLLFLTDLKGYDVVMGKLVATSLNAFYSVVAVVPMLAIPLLMGGITLGEFGRMALVAVNTLFFSLALGMCVSSLSRSALFAATATCLVLLFLTALMPACGAILAEFGKTRELEPVFLLPSVGFSFYLALDKPYLFNWDKFWWSMLLTHFMAWVFLALASVIAPRAWRDRPAGIQRLRWRRLWQSWTYGNLAERIAFRRYLLDQNAFFWLAARVRLKPASVWAVLGLLACGWAWGLAKFGHEWLATPTYLVTAFTLNLLLRVWFGSEATRQFAEDRKAGTLELILSTTVTVPEILRGQLLALRRQFLAPVLAALALEFLFMLAGLSQELGTEADRTLWVLFWLALMGMLVADLAALYWVGMWQGLTAKTQNHASGVSLTRVLLIPWVVIGLVVMWVALTSLSPGTRQEPGEGFFLGLWFFVGIAVDIAFGATARHKLLKDFRRAAEQRYAKPVGFWARLLGTSGGREWKGTQ